MSMMSLRMAMFGLCLASASSVCFGQATILRVEEDWELLVEQPDQQLDAPQITTTLMPLGEASSLYFQLDMNHGSDPAYSTGGIQVKALNGDSCLNAQRSLAGQRLYVPSERITWTQVLIQSEQWLHFGIVAGQSQSWGAFGGPQSFVHLQSSGTLENYNPEHSAQNSGVIYAGNRVGYLRLAKVRYFMSTGDIVESEVNLDAQH